MILICYDRSADARAAIEQAGSFMAGGPATVLTVWEPFAHVLSRSPTGLGPMAGLACIDEIDAATRAKR